MSSEYSISFTGKRALVTGAGKGIGRDICLRLHQCGARVVAISRNQEDLDNLSREIPSLISIAADLGDVEQAKEAARRAGAVDLLVNNAGISILEPFLSTDINNFQKVLDVNLKQVLVVSQIVARDMIRRGVAGAIVNVSSQASSVAIKDHTSYCSSKGALDQLTRMMALELGAHGIRCNSVNPTVVLTPMGEKAWSNPEKANPMLDSIPLHRFAKPVEVSNVVLFLLSDYASMMTGALVPVDGGFLAC